MMVTTAPPSQTKKITSEFDSWVQLGFFKRGMKTQKLCRKNCSEQR